MVFVGYPTYWSGGRGNLSGVDDPTRVIQGIVTRMGFLGAGVIMKEGLNISGLTTAASVRAASVIGVLVGVGLYGAASLLTCLSAILMMWGARLEMRLPSRHAISIGLRFVSGHAPSETWLQNLMLEQGYDIAGGSLTINSDGEQSEWRLVAVALDPKRGASLPSLADKFQAQLEIARFTLAHARN